MNPAVNFGPTQTEDCLESGPGWWLLNKSPECMFLKTWICWSLKFLRQNSEKKMFVLKTPADVSQTGMLDRPSGSTLTDGLWFWSWWLGWVQCESGDVTSCVFSAGVSSGRQRFTQKLSHWFCSCFRSNLQTDEPAGEPEPEPESEHR